MGDLTEDFSEWEFRCKCGCGICNVNRNFINKLQATRTIAVIPFSISSGCRCPKHNKKEGGKKNSDHLTTKDIECEGADIECSRSYDRFKIIDAAYKAGFRRIFAHKGFVHLGSKKENPQNVLGLY